MGEGGCCAVRAQICVYNAQMALLTVNDLCRITDYTRDQIRGLLDAALPERSSRGPRVAREFRPQQFLLIVVMAELETTLGIKRNYVAAISKNLAKALSGPRPPSQQAWLKITFAPPNVTYSDAAVSLTDGGVVLALKPVFQRVDPYVAAVTARSTQLRFPPMAVPRHRNASNDANKNAPLAALPMRGAKRLNVKPRREKGAL